MNIVTVNRDTPVDTLRGFACILLVAYHVIGIAPDNGLHVQEGVLKDANALLIYIRMPIFTFLSGFVYARRPFTSDWKKFMAGKIRRLIIPMLFVGTLFALVQTITPGTNAAITDWRFLHLMPVAHYWFIEALFLIFLVIVPLEHFKFLQNKAGFALIFIIAAILYVTNAGTPWLSIAGALYLFPYFLLGLYCSRFPLQIKNQKALGYLLITVIILFLLFFGQQYGGGRRSLNALIIGTMFCIGLLFIKTESVFLSKIGIYSYGIYLFHIFFTAASRIFFVKTGITEIWILFILGTTLGLAGPMLVERIAAKYNPTRILLLGKRPKESLVIAESSGESRK
jgi:peptidoglycan/LPS O-acetylase OafA/YrhL